MSKKVGWSFWWLWTIAHVIGSAVLPLLVWQDPYDLRSRIFLNEILQGIGVSLAQSMVLRDRFTKEGWWLPLSLIGWTIGMTLIFFVPSLSIHVHLSNFPPMTLLIIDFAIIGTIVGICQWQLLKSFRTGGLWLFASPIALSLSIFGLQLGYMAKSSALATALQGVIYGAITGLAAIKVLRSPKILPKSRKQ
ncbi:hypothetical protein [Pseudanabaena sp. ABRG5-3]|uniref:hypothetical protein n=1 Tax=Pseudanabaena sp. ABRG5-3 TaxID=685565 RepID=UPI000DC6DED2|nr:hypothetical protein [Pseudanabaena sp. ABRG5-3]BBC24804.1 hypothetical protein ABRG53_2547 [Pseudanabaena sp. ABRG5-3]